MPMPSDDVSYAAAKAAQEKRDPMKGMPFMNKTGSGIDTSQDEILRKAGNAASEKRAQNKLGKDYVPKDKDKEKDKDKK